MSETLHWPHGYHGVESPYYDDPVRRLRPYPSKRKTLCTVEPIVQYGLREARYTSVEHAMREATAIAYLVGRGYDPRTAHRIVESWEVNERF
ncbi:hypothetical protein [Thermoflavimicrobium dichotomicum]|uniref:Uncharacterized protein n=1 Tax=Thermoflavimicrobium dichotomicum TaxID=46223 RepID=A0A1I3PXM9_9BACL|nr:hypothetical protein [Thermoflavimicrobium dichotomicum]SFJ26199.1 hypothetical protein SAMN05421852_106156 [Thermoflavimicrobium dichotomicum]